jgi:hypothetical protein
LIKASEVDSVPVAAFQVSANDKNGAVYHTILDNGSPAEDQYINIYPVLDNKGDGPSIFEGSTDNDAHVNFAQLQGYGDDSQNTNLVAKHVRGKFMPQYLLASELTEDASGAKTGRFLVALTDSVKYYEDDEKKAELFQWNGHTRLAFLEGQLRNDDSLLVLKGSTNPPINVKETLPGGREGIHSPVLFSFRNIDPCTEEIFLIETDSSMMNNFENNVWLRMLQGEGNLSPRMPVLFSASFDEARSFDNLSVYDALFSLNTHGNVANELIKVTQGSVIGEKGRVIVRNAAGKKVFIANILGQTLANRTLSSDETAITVPAGIVIVAIEGEKAVKVLVK